MKKIRSTMLYLTISLLAVLFFALTVSAEDIKITYNYYGGGVWETAKPNEDGSYTLRATKKSGDESVTLADGATKVSKEFYGWFTNTGAFYAPGENVTFTETTQLYEAYGITVFNAADFYAATGTNQKGIYVKLGADLTLDKSFGGSWSTTVVDMNGHNITSVTKEYSINLYRGALIILGNGKLIHSPVELAKEPVKTCCIRIQPHGYGDEGNPELCWIGKDVEIITPYNLLGTTHEDNWHSINNDMYKGAPNMVIAGKVTALSLFRVGVCTNATCDIKSTANITITGNSLFNIYKDTGVIKYMTLTLDGKIVMQDPEAVFVSDIMQKGFTINVKGGNFAISKADKERLQKYLDSGLYLAEDYVDGIEVYVIKKDTKAHNWVVDTSKSKAATKTESGHMFYFCDKCGAEKDVETVYDPSETEITVTLRDKDGNERDVKVKANEIFTIAKDFVGKYTKYSIVGVATNYGEAQDKVVGIEIPFGFYMFGYHLTDNNVLEKVTVASGADVIITYMDRMKSIKSYVIMDAKVYFKESRVEKTLAEIRSDVPGADVKFGASTFYQKGSLKSLTMSTGSKYDFGNASFQQTGIEELVFPDGASVVFSGDSAFYQSNVKTVYVGSGINLDKKPFNQANKLEYVVVMDAATISDNAFAAEGAEKATSLLVVFVHSKNVAFSAKAFNNRLNHGVVVYTVDPDVVTFENCSYEIYNGIPHSYIENVVKAPTCIEEGILGYKTICPCGKFEEAVCKVYKSGESREIVYKEGAIPLSDVHVLGTKLSNVYYDMGYDHSGVREYWCLLCNKAKVKEQERRAAPLVVDLGYSVSTFDGKYSLVHGYDVDSAAATEYKSVIKKLELGMVIHLNTSDKEVSVLDVFNNTPMLLGKPNSIKRTFTLTTSYLEIKFTGISDVMGTNRLILDFYVYDGSKVYYFENGVASELAKGISYSEIVEMAK